MATVRAEQVTEPVAQHGEGPVWDPRARALRFVDLLAGDLLTVETGGEVSRQHVGEVLAAFRPRRTGGFVIAVERGFRLLGADLQPEGPVVTAFEDEGLRMNDGGCDPQGRFYCGSMAYDESPGAGALFRLDPDGSVRTVLQDVTISNGLQWSADGATAFYNDTPTGRIDRFDFDGGRGSLAGRRPFATLADGQGWPDGMSIDADGGVWTACWGGGAVRRFAPDGSPDLVVEVPVPNPTACAFGGPAGTTLYITTSREGGGDAAASSGAVFAVDVGVRGGAVHAFAG